MFLKLCLMKKLLSLECLATDDIAREQRDGGVFNEIKYENIHASLLKDLRPIPCSGVLYVLEKQQNHQQIWADLNQDKTRYIFDTSTAMMLLHNAADFLDVADRDLIVYLEDCSYYLNAESFTRGKKPNLEFIKRILTCKINPQYLYPSGTGIIVAQ